MTSTTITIITVYQATTIAKFHITMFALLSSVYDHKSNMAQSSKKREGGGLLLLLSALLCSAIFSLACSAYSQSVLADHLVEMKTYRN